VEENCIWVDFVEELCDRFGDEGMIDVVEFNKLR